jgi:uridine phosphorylase
MEKTMIGKKNYPILEFDTSTEAIVEPSNILKPIHIAECCVITFFRDVIDKYKAKGKLKEIISLRCETLDLPIYETIIDGKRICLVQGFVGSAGAAGYLEEMIALGIKKFIVCGGAGVLQKDIAVGHLIVPTSAVRDEGTSYHYLPPSREVMANNGVIDIITSELDKNNVPYLTGKTWTTDSFYRETKDKVALRVEEGCLCVEMEASAYMAVAQFRGIKLGQILYGGDDVSGDKWDNRKWHTRNDIRERLVEMSFDICLKI